MEKSGENHGKSTTFGTVEYRGMGVLPSGKLTVCELENGP